MEVLQRKSLNIQYQGLMLFICGEVELSALPEQLII